MKNLFLITFIFSLLAVESCSYVSYTPKSKAKRLQEQPSILIFDRIVDFRIEQRGWPVSRQDFISKGIKYYEVFDGFQYQTTSFNVIDSNTMDFYFRDHIKDIEKEKRTRRTDINSYNGSVHFYKENGKFLYRIKMR